MTVESFTLGDANARRRYDELFESCPDAFIQQSTWWAEVIGELSPDTPIFLLCRDGERDVAGLPLYLFECEHGNILTSVPHHGALGGVFCAPGLGEEAREQAYAALIREAESQASRRDCMAWTVITNPFDEDSQRYLRHMKPDCVFENFTQSMEMGDVFSDGRIILDDYTKRSSNLSRIVRKAHAGGFEVSPCETEAELEVWYRIHSKRLREVGAMPILEGHVANVHRILVPRGKAALMLAKKGGRIASGILYIRHRHVMDIIAISMDSEFADWSPNYRLTEHSIPWAAGLGVRTYNWQSMSARESGVCDYKRRWGGRERPYFFMTRIMGSRERLLKLGTEGLRHSYPHHFVVPFAALEDGFRAGRYRKN